MNASRLTSPERGYRSVMLSAIMTKPDFAEACFLIAVIVFVLGVILTLTKSAWPYIRVLDYTGLGLVALGFLAL